jgi:folate-binding protein YgfZ
VTRLDDIAVLRVSGRDAVKVLHSLTTQHMPAFLADAWEAAVGSGVVPPEADVVPAAPADAAAAAAAAAAVVDSTMVLAGAGFAAGGVRVAPSFTCFAAWLTPKGRLLFDTVIELERFPSGMAAAARAHRAQVEQPTRFKQPSQAAANALAGASFLVHVPRARAAELQRHIKASALRIDARLAVDDSLAVWVAAVREAAPEDAVASGILAAARDAEEVAEEAAEEAAAAGTPAATTPAPAGASAETPVYRVFVDPRVSHRTSRGGRLGAFSYAPPESPAATARRPPEGPLGTLLPAGELALVRITGPAGAPPPLPPRFVRTHRAVYDVARTVLGLPETGAELVPEKTLPLEANVDLLNGIHFHKGCYLGQELTTRTHFQGLVRKRVLPVFFRPFDTALAPRAAAAPAAPGAPAAAAAAVGELPWGHVTEVTSAAEPARALPRPLRANEPAVLTTGEDGSLGVGADADAETEAVEQALFPWDFFDSFSLDAVPTAGGAPSPPRSPAALAASLGLAPGSPLWASFVSQFDAAPHENRIAGYAAPRAGAVVACPYTLVSAGAPAAGAGLVMTNAFNLALAAPAHAAAEAAAAAGTEAEEAAGPREVEVGKVVSLPRLGSGAAVSNVGFAQVRMAEAEEPFGHILVRADPAADADARAGACGDLVWEAVPLCPQWLAGELDRAGAAKAH